MEEGDPFLCCDCDSEMAAYSAKDRSDLKRASRERMEQFVLCGQASGSRNARSSMLEAARAALQTTDFYADGDRESAARITTDKEQDFFAGMGSAEIGPCCAALARYMHDVVLPRDEENLSLLELGAGCGSVGLWLWKKRHPELRVCLTDVPRLVPLLQLNCDLNFAAGQVIARQLRWGVTADTVALAAECSDAAWQGGTPREPFDFVVGADAAYNEDKSFPLMETLNYFKPKKAAYFAQAVHPEHEVEGRNAIEALKERAEEAGWHSEEVATLDTDVVLHAEAFTCVILKLTPPEEMSARKSRHSRFD